MWAFVMEAQNEVKTKREGSAWSVLVLAEGNEDLARWSLVLAQRPHGKEGVRAIDLPCSPNAHTRMGWTSLVNPCARGRRHTRPIVFSDRRCSFTRARLD